jgi:glutathione S-transferase
MLTACWQQGSGRLGEVSGKEEASMITLYGFGAGFGLPEKSPFVTKTEVQLKMAGLDYCKRMALPPASPKGQMPFIEDDGEQIADSTFIRAHIEGKYGFDFDAGLSPLQRAQAWAVERMVEHHVYSALIAARWLDPENFAKGPTHFFDGAPEQMRETIRANALVRVAENYRVGGLGRHAPDEAVGLAVRSLSALSQLLAKSRYLMGERPCGTDATVFGMVAGILTPFFDSPLRRRAKQFENLNAYADRMMAQFYPDHPWSEQELAA